MLKINFTKIHADLIAKEIFKSISSYEKRQAKALKTEMDSKQAYNSVRTQRHWQAVATVDLCIAETKKKYEALIELDKQVNWSRNLHQDRYKFVEKYPDILKTYYENYLIYEVVAGEK